MKIALLAGASSIHTVRWANGLSSLGHEVHVITQHAPSDPISSNVHVHQFSNHGDFGYFLMVPKVRDLFQRLKPDIVNAHYASGYGTTARLVDYHPWLLSVWGSDVFDFPHKTPFHKWLVKKNLRAADRVASTSHCMAEVTRKLTPELTNIAITPFGVDLAVFASSQPSPAIPKRSLVIGTVKTMKPKYGIDTLIEAFALLQKSLQVEVGIDPPNTLLRLVGGGEQIPELRALAKRLGVADKVQFVGQIPHVRVPQELAKLDIFVALSRLESFGVAIIEAGAAGCPVVVSDAGGLPEVTVEGVTGFIVPRDNPRAAAAALEQLVLCPSLRLQMGHAGHAHVTKHYSWNASIQTMLSVYEETRRAQ